MTLARSRTWRVLAATLLACALLWPLLPAVAAARQTRSRRELAAQQQPVRVPQLPPATQQSKPTATPTPTPKQTPTPTPAQSQPPTGAVIDDDEVIHVTSNLVVVPASVTTAQGAPVQGLKPTDFHLEEEGRTQEIAQVGDAEQVPLDIAILFDVSSSVTAKNFFTFQQQAAARFLKDVLKPIDRAAIITIGAQPTLVEPLTNAAEATNKLVTIPAALQSVPTAFYDSVTFAAKYLAENAPGRHRRVILVISDGDDNFSNAVREQTVAEYEAQRKAEEAGGDRPQAVRAAARRDLEARHRRAVVAVQRDVQRSDIVFYAINPGGPSIHLNESATRAQNSMQQIADATGGTAYVPENADALATVFRQIANELRAQYLLQYYSNSNAPNGKYLTIKVTSPTHPDLRIRARQGYYAKK